uniref:Uncharacterized protein n=1 Tax=Seriola lalandi dorsalis TaxID=1841481 RepID=A0A3B4WM46_SERLL
IKEKKKNREEEEKETGHEHSVTIIFISMIALNVGLELLKTKTTVFFHKGTSRSMKGDFCLINTNFSHTEPVQGMKFTIPEKEKPSKCLNCHKKEINLQIKFMNCTKLNKCSINISF